MNCFPNAPNRREEPKSLNNQRSQQDPPAPGCAPFATRLHSSILRPACGLRCFWGKATCVFESTSEFKSEFKAESESEFKSEFQSESEFKSAAPCVWTQVFVWGGRKATQNPNVQVERPAESIALAIKNNNTRRQRFNHDVNYSNKMQESCNTQH